MSDSQQTPWVGFLILFIVFAGLISMCGQCGDDVDKATGTSIKTAPVNDYKPITNISYRFLDKNELVGDPIWKQGDDIVRRSYAYEITNFDKDNPECWTDLHNLAESVAEKRDHEMLTMVYFFAPSDSLVLWHDSETKWDISWSDSQESLWIGNYIRFANGNTQMVKGTNWK